VRASRSTWRTWTPASTGTRPPCACATRATRSPSYDFPLLAQLYLQGKLDLDGMVTRTITLDEVEDAFHMMETGDDIRP
jgi:Zn-dependent alcohol dehydrogenase